MATRACTIDDPKEIRGSFGCVMVMLGVFTLLWSGGTGYLLVEQLEGYAQQAESASWPTAPAVITESRVSVEPGADSTTYSADIAYRYTVDGAPYEGDRVRLTLTQSTSDSSDARRVVDRYPAGAEVRVAYDPDDPATSVLEPGLSERDAFPFVFLSIFVSVSLLLIAALLRLAYIAIVLPEMGFLKRVRAGGGREHVLLRCMPVWPALFGLIGVAFVATFVHLLALDARVTETSATITIGVAIVTVAGLFVGQAIRRRPPKHRLTLDTTERTLTFHSSERGALRTVALDDFADAEIRKSVKVEKRRDRTFRSSRFTVRLLREDGEPANVHTFRSDLDADGVRRWLTLHLSRSSLGGT